MDTCGAQTWNTLSVALKSCKVPLALWFWQFERRKEFKREGLVLAFGIGVRSLILSWPTGPALRRNQFEVFR